MHARTCGMAGFTFRVLVFGLPTPEYRYKGRVLIESKFSTPITYKSNFRNDGECWVTPYQVRVDVSGASRTSLFRLYVDGVLVNWKVYSGEKSFIFKGVCGTTGTRELLFCIPTVRRVNFNGKCWCSQSSGQPPSVSNTGTISVVEFEAIYRGSEYQHWKGVSLSHRRVSTLTCRPTSKEGKLLERINEYDTFHVWDVGHELGRQCIEYHAAHTLQEMGIPIVDMNWGKLSNMVKNY